MLPVFVISSFFIRRLAFAFPISLLEPASPRSLNTYLPSQTRISLYQDGSTSHPSSLPFALIPPRTPPNASLQHSLLLSFTYFSVPLLRSQPPQLSKDRVVTYTSIVSETKQLSLCRSIVFVHLRKQWFNGRCLVGQRAMFETVHLK